MSRCDCYPTGFSPEVYDGLCETCPLAPEPHLGSLPTGPERVTDLGPGRASGPRLTDGDSLQAGDLRTSKGGATSAGEGVGVEARVLVDDPANLNAEQKVSGIDVHASRMLDVPTSVKRS